MIDYEWLKSIKPGDRVGVRSGYSNRVSVSIVAKTTAQQIVISGSGDRYRIKDGYKCGNHDSWSHPCLVRLTDEMIESIRHDDRVRYLDSIRWSEQSRDLVLAVYERVRDTRPGRQ